MGSAKNAMMEHEDDVAMATGYLSTFGTLERCEFHDTVFLGDGDMTSAYKRANAMITAGEITLRDGQTRRDFTDLLLAAFEENGYADSCNQCDKNRDD